MTVIEDAKDPQNQAIAKINKIEAKAVDDGLGSTKHHHEERSEQEQSCQDTQEFPMSCGEVGDDGGDDQVCGGDDDLSLEKSPL